MVTVEEQTSLTDAEMMLVHSGKSCRSLSLFASHKCLISYLNIVAKNVRLAEYERIPRCPHLLVVKALIVLLHFFE